MNRILLVGCAVLSFASWAQSAPNDLCSGAEALSFTAGSALSGVSDPNTASAAVEQTFSCSSSVKNSVWFSFTAPSTGTWEVTTCGTATNYDSLLAVYAGSCGALTNVTDGCNDQGPNCSSASQVLVSLTAGSTYFVQVAVWSSSTLASTMRTQVRVRPATIPANLCAGATALSLNAPVSFNTNAVTTNDSQISGTIDGGAGPTCFSGVGHSIDPLLNTGRGRDLDFRFDPPATGLYSFRYRSPSTINGVLYVTDSCVDATTPPQLYAPPQCIAASNRQGGSLGAEEAVCVPLTQGTPVFAHVDEASLSTAGTYGLEVEVNSCTLETAGNESPAGAGPLACPVTGGISPAGDIDYFSLGSPSTASRVYAMVDALSSGASGSLASDFDLRVTDGTTTLEYDNADVDTLFGGSAPSIAGTPLAAGAPSYLQVRYNSATALAEPYRLYSVIQSGTPTAESEPNDDLATAGGGVTNYFSGTVSATTDVDLFGFAAEAGELLFLSLDTEPTRTATGSTANLSLQLLDGNGAALVAVNDSATTINNGAPDAGLNSVAPTVPSEGLVYRVRTSGLFFARVGRVSSTGASAYQLSISRNCGVGGGVGAPTATAVSPSTGSTAGGTTVTVTGTGFNAGTQVRLGTQAVTVSSRTSTTLTFNTPAGLEGAVDVVVINPGNQTATLTGAFTYVAPAGPPVVASVSPVRGPAAGGTSVTITGSNFKTGAAVTFGSVAATAVVVVGPTQITAVTPLQAPGVVAVTVTNTDALSGTLPAAFTVLGQPTLTAVSPATGLSSGGTTVTLTGTQFRAGAVVKFGSATATGVVVNSATSITAVTPSTATAGPVAVSVTNDDGQVGTLAAAFTYLYPAPTLTAISPAEGLPTGGQTVTLTGTNFIGVLTVRFGTAAATNVTRVSATQATAVTPPGTPGVVDVTFGLSDGQTVTLPGAFTYLAPPTLTAVAPARGPQAGGTHITLTGTGFRSPAQVSLDGVPAVAVRVVSPTTITATTQGQSPGTKSVTVVNGDTQQVTLAAAFTYAGAPTLTRITPAGGVPAGGTLVHLFGEGFPSDATVQFGGTEATMVTFISSQELSAVAPAGVGSVDVTVRNTEGGASTLRAAWRYQDAPTVTAVVPATGLETGGTAVTLTGTGFRSSTQVRFGGTPVASLTFVSETEVKIVTPVHAAGAVDIEVANEGAASSLSGGFTFTRQPVVLAAIAPTSGSVEGGTVMTLSGTGFAPGATVTVGGAAATGVTVVSSTIIRATAPAHAAGRGQVTVTNDDGQSASLDNAFTWVEGVSTNPGTVADGGSGAVGEEPAPIEGGAGGVSCGCSSFDGSVFTLASLGLLLLRSRRRRS